MEQAFPDIQHGHLSADFPRHDHRVWEIHLFTGGRGRFVQGGRVWAVEAGSVTFSPPGAAHELAVDPLLSFYYLQFAADRETQAVLRRLTDLQHAQGPLRVDPAAAAEAGRLKDRLDSPVADRVASGLHGFRAWLYDLAAGTEKKPADGVDEALAWLGRHLDSSITLDDWAAVAGLDRFAFSRRFKARTGLPPLAYAHRAKVEAACFLLAGTSEPLADVAQKLGFCDEFHFGKVFKKWRGVPPGQWRREHKNPEVSASTEAETTPAGA